MNQLAAASCALIGHALQQSPALNKGQHTGPGDGGVALDSEHRAWGGGRDTGLSTCTVDCKALAQLQTIKRHVTLEHSQAGLTSHALPHHTSTPSHMCMTLYKRQEVLHTSNDTYTHIMHIHIPSHLQRPHTLPQSNLNNYTQAPYTCTYSHDYKYDGELGSVGVKPNSTFNKSSGHGQALGKICMVLIIRPCTGIA